MARKLKAPVLVITGELDRPEDRLKAYEFAGSRRKACIRVESASHFMAWEKQRHTLHAAALEWLDTATVQGKPGGCFRADWQGRYSPA
jgi:pimeloyl-ACP methyl ester carboxylesterase